MYNDYYSAYGTESLVDATKGSVALTGMFFGIMIFSLILSLISIISNWKIFNKAGKPGWASIVPIYNYVVMIQIAKLSLVYLVLFFVPIANIYAIFKINIEIAKKFGKSAGFGVGMTLIPIIFIPLLAFSDNTYEDNIVENTANNSYDEANSINNLDVNSVNSTDNNEPNIPPITENVINNEPINEIPTIENTENNVVTETSSVETNNIIEPQNVEVNNIVEPQEFNSIPNPMGENSANNIPNAFNQTPIMSENTVVNEPINEVPATPIQDIPLNEPVVPEANISIEPQIAVATQPTVQPETLQKEESINIEGVQTVNPLENNNGKKYCKSCGNEMPDIVSICPNCGTDNE